MEMTADQFCDVLNGLKRPQGTSGGVPNRRRGQRVNQLGWAEFSTVYPLPSQPESPLATVTVHDLSIRGIGLLQDRPMQHGSQFIVKLNRTDQPPLPLLYSVTNHRKISDDLFAIGAELLRVVTDEPHGSSAM